MFWTAVITLAAFAFTGFGWFVHTYRADENRHRSFAAPQVRPWAGHTTWDERPPPTITPDDPRHPNHIGRKF